MVASRRIKNVSDYFVGGKKLGYWVVAFSSRATGESAWLLLGLTGAGAAWGISAMWIVVGEVLGVAGAWFFMARRFKERTDAYDSITIPDYLVSHFKDHAKLLRLVAAFALAIFVTIYVSAQIDATGKAFENFLGWKKTPFFAKMGPNAGYYSGALVGFVIVIAYTFSGGFVAVAWSDLFQGSLMLIGLVALPIAAYLLIPEGGGLFEQLGAIDAKAKAAADTLKTTNPEAAKQAAEVALTSWLGAKGVPGLIASLAIGIGFLGSPQVFVRFMSIKNQDDIKKGRIVAIVFTVLTDAGAVLIGLIGRAILAPHFDVEATLGENAENVLPMLVKYTFPTIIVGVYIAAVLSAIMSTVDSLLVVASSAVTRDYYQQIKHPDMSDEKLTKMSRNVTVILALIALTISLIVAYVSPTRSIFWFVIFGWSGISATFCPMIILSLFWKKYNSVGALASMLTGFLCVPLFKFVMVLIPWGLGEVFAGIGELFPSFVVAFIAGVIATTLSKPRALADTVS